MLVCWGGQEFLLDMLKRHRLAFAVVSISAWVWIYTCLRISICKRKINELCFFAGSTCLTGSIFHEPASTLFVVCFRIAPH
jgi:hypothetical protein